jgi:hypothetical protein
MLANHARSKLSGKKGKKNKKGKKCCASWRMCCTKVPIHAGRLDRVYYALFQCRWVSYRQEFKDQMVSRYQERTLSYMQQGLTYDEAIGLRKQNKLLLNPDGSEL